MQLAWFGVCLVIASGCDKVFRLDPLIDAPEPFDASMPDTRGWPSDGGVGPRPCPPSGTDEDGDGVFDDCDNCPADPNNLQDDGDRDGIGDVCDPHPDFAVERLAAFFGFNGTSTPGMQITSQGSWTTANGVLRQGGMTTGRTLFVLDGTWHRPVVEIKGVYAYHSGIATSYWLVGVALINDIPTTLAPDQIACRGHFLVGAGNDTLDLVRMRDGAVTTSGTAKFTQGDPMFTLQVTGEAHGGVPECAGERVDMPPRDLLHVAIPRDATDAADPRVGLFTLASNVDFMSLTVYETVFD